MLDILNFNKLFVAWFADTVNFLKTIVFIEGCYSGFLADIRPAFRPGLLFPTRQYCLQGYTDVMGIMSNFHVGAWGHH